MTTSRREKIESLLKDEPQDVLLCYSLALELEGCGEWEAGLEILEQLARENPPYVPAFHMAGQHLVKHGRVADARRALREGIEAARAASESHAAAEMAELLTSLGSAGED